MWGRELEDQTIAFREQALKISKWDKMLLENSSKILELHDNVTKVEHAQKQLDTNLEVIQRQQEELHQLLDQVEDEVEKVYKQRADDMNMLDDEREKGYEMAQHLNDELDQLEGMLKGHIAKLNASHVRAADSDNPMCQVVEILNAHLHSLQWVNENSNQLQSKLNRLSKEFEFRTMQTGRLRYDHPYQ